MMPLAAQYNITQGITISDCSGTLTDSNADSATGNYGLNENNTFTVCVPTADNILITFNTFSTEPQYDFLAIHEGVGLSGALLGGSPYSGNIPPPPLVIYNTNNDPVFCFTFHFVSDLNISDIGFEVAWATTLSALPPLQPFTIPSVSCYDQTLFLNLNSPVLCSAVTTDAFAIIGIGNPTVANAAPIACNAEGLTTQIALNLVVSIEVGSQYDIIFNYEYIDACGGLWSTSSSADFTVTNCPLTVLGINLSNELCDNCATITANVVGGNFDYTYTWDPPLGNIASTLICPAESQWYSVTVNDGLGQSATQSIYVDVCPFQINFIDAPTTVCGGGGCFNLITATTGGSPPYSYAWNVPAGNIPIGNESFVTPYCLGSSGTFSVTVTDDLGNTTTNSFAATVCPMQVSINSDDVVCGCGNLVANATGGAGGPWGNDYYYTYTWSPPIAQNTATNPICPTNPAIYTVTVSDTYGASASAEVFVPVCPFQVIIDAPDIVCGSCVPIIANVSPPPSATLSYTYTWDPPLPNGNNISSDTVCVVVPTVYYVTVSNQFGESVTANTVIDVCPLQVTIPSPAVCSGACTNIFADAAGGIPPYSYLWNDPALSGNLSPICVTAPVTYSVTITDTGGSTATAFQNVLPCDFAVQIIAPNEFCHCDSIFAQAVGGTWSYAYTWNPPLSSMAGWHPLCLENEEAYSVTVTDLGTGATATATKTLTVCPFEVTIEGANMVCNDTAQVEALIEGGYPPYLIAWNVASLPPTTGVHSIAISEPTTFIVTVSDTTGFTVSDTLLVTPQAPPNLPDTIRLCLDDGVAVLNAAPIDGTWSGNYINAATGTFNATASGLGNFWATYSTAYCSDSAVIKVLPNPTVADAIYCNNDIPVALPLPDMPDGSWVGSHVIDPAGWLMPDSIGAFNLTYTAPNGCTVFNSVTVLQGISVSSPILQICSSPLNIDEMPPGGLWDVAPGLDIVNGVLYPSGAGLGQHTLYYRLPGSECADSITITVTDVAIGIDEAVLCPQATAILLPALQPQSGGEWSSITPSQTGLSNTVGLYNPALVGSGYDEYVVFSFDGCSDTMHISVIPTLTTPDTLRFCSSTELFDLSGIGSPTGGIWVGNQVVLSGNTYYFDRSEVGTYNLTYSINSCDADLTVLVGTVSVSADLNLCNATEPVILETPTPAGGTWSGVGIPSSGNGVFNPAISGSGIFALIYTALSGCSDTMYVTVSETAIPEIAPIDNFFCLRDTVITLDATPIGGTWSGPGITGNTFNPSIAGAGGWLLTYHYGIAECATEAYLSVSVGDTLRVLLSPDTTICAGAPTVIWAQAYGGKNNGYTYTWGNGLDYQQIHTITPTENTAYTLTVSDACSSPLLRQINVAVNPPPAYTVTVSDTLCYGETGTAALLTPPDQHYAFAWQHEVSLSAAAIQAETGNYSVTISDFDTGCSAVVLVTIPYYPLLAANFAPNPNSLDCLPTLTLQMIDYSLGIGEAYWDFGDGTTELYVLGAPPVHTYALPGIYTISLYAENENDCHSLYQHTVCLEFDNDLLLPSAFSPNGDGINDVYRAIGIGIDVFELHIYNRWGQRVFSTTQLAEAWDGTYQGQVCDIGAYSYYVTYSTTQSMGTELLRGSLLLLR